MEDFMEKYKKLLNNYERIPRENHSIDNREVQAIADIRQMLGLLEKRILGQLTKEDEERVKDQSQKWMDSIHVLREYIEKKW